MAAPLLLALLLAAPQEWMQWRGPRSTGAAPGADPPVAWSEEKNVRWKTPLPGLGHSTPVVTADRVYVTTAVPVGPPLEEPRFDDAPGSHNNLPVTRRHRFAVLALSRKDGKILWDTTVREALPHAGGHETGSLASGSPVTDGRRVWAFFGSYGLYCLDRDGNVVWHADFGLMRTKHAHGEGASPALHGDTLVVTWDHESDSFVVALDAATGRERWRAERDEPTSWATPLIVEHDGKAQAVVSGTTRVRAYDLATGRVVWEVGGLPNNVVASPVAGHGLVIAGASYEHQAMVAVRLEGARGDVTGTDRVAWTKDRRTPYVPSPLLYGDWIYYLAHYQGVLSRADVRTGEEPSGPFRLPGVGNIYASPVGAAGRIYVTDMSGATIVFSHEDPTKAFALNRLDDRFSASAAIAGRELFLRGHRNLYCIARPD